LKRKSDIWAQLKRGKIPQELSEVKGKLEVATGITPTFQAKDDVYHCIGMGGGGYGDPLARDSELVLRDVINGLVTPEWAERMYGVVVRGKPLQVDWAATQKKRDAIYAQRAKSVETRKSKTVGVKRETSNVKRQNASAKRAVNGKGAAKKKNSKTKSRVKA
jgi:N-methylhydantoinase B